MVNNIPQSSNNQISTSLATAGNEVDEIKVKFSPQLLSLLSQHLYSSPNKAFEELVSNSWDANATNVYIDIPEDLTGDNAAIWILDNGISMNVDGLQQLWQIANSTKRTENPTGRKQIGKFGIGKLATYVLANEFTYICKADDGVMRVVTMDYRKIDLGNTEHLEELPLSVRELASMDDLKLVLDTYSGGDSIFSLIKDNFPEIKITDKNNEYGGASDAKIAKKNTWTLAILTSLKDEGKTVQRGWIRRLLSTALPLGSSIAISLNLEPITSSKDTTPIHKSWILGPDLNFDEFSTDEGSSSVSIVKKAEPYPHIIIEGVGEVTGSATYYKSNIRGGKSDQIGDSNGFFVNVLGRVINAEDNLFKLKDLNTSVLAQFRATIRVDSLDNQISANREGVAEGTEIKKVRGLLRKLFNLARQEYNKLEDKTYDDSGKGDRGSLGSFPVATLTDVIQSALETNEALPNFIAAGDSTDSAIQREWLTGVQKDITSSVGTVEFREEMPQESLVKYDLAQRTIVINKNHPFAKENSHTIEQVNTLKDTAVVDLLTDAFMLKIGISPDLCHDVIQHRDRAMRHVAQIRRSSATHIIALLNKWQVEVKPFETIIGDALEYLGFSVIRYGQSGEPEGVGTAFITPNAEDSSSVYTFTYDAKSTTHSSAKTSNLNIAGLARHRKDYQANYSLVVAPNYQKGAVEKEATDNHITPITTAMLAKLVSITLGYGPINLIKIRELFSIFEPDLASDWIDALEKEMNQNAIVDISVLVKALEELTTTDKMDILSCDLIAHKYRELTGSKAKPTKTDVAQVIRGLSLIAPNAIYIDRNSSYDVFILTRPNMLIQEIKRQTAEIPESLKMGVTK